MDGIDTFLGTTRARILGILRRSSATVADLAEAVGITGNAVRAHVAALQRDGLVQDAGSTPSTGGKPAQLYEITPAAEELFPKGYGVVLRELIRVLQGQEGQEAAIETLRDVGRRLAGEPPPPDRSTEARVAAAADLLRSIGGEVEVTREDGTWRVAGVGCPLGAVVAHEPELCSLAHALVTAATACEVTELCDRSGERPRCVFTVSDKSTTRS